MTESKRTYGSMHAVLMHMTSNADRLITLTELEQIQPTGSVPGTLSTVCSQLIQEYPQMERVSRGVFRWNSTVSDEVPATEKPARTDAAEKEYVLLRIIERATDGRTLTFEEETGKFYTLATLQW